MPSFHPDDCRCSRCFPRSPADDARAAVRARLLVAAIMAVTVLLVALIMSWRIS